MYEKGFTGHLATFDLAANTVCDSSEKCSTLVRQYDITNMLICTLWIDSESNHEPKKISGYVAPYAEYHQNN